jgi:phage tail sheath protein FI
MMPEEPAYPAVYIEEIPSGVRTISGVPTSVTAFLGRTLRGPVNEAVTINSFTDFERSFGELDAGCPLTFAVREFYHNGGNTAVVVRLINSTDGDDESSPLDEGAYLGNANLKTGMYALGTVDIFNLLCIPPDSPNGDTAPEVYQAAMQFCADHRAMLIVDAPAEWSANGTSAVANAVAGLSDLGLTGVAARNAALYFPRVREPNPLEAGQLITLAPCGIVAGVMARTDAQRGARCGVDRSGERSAQSAWY